MPREVQGIKLSVLDTSISEEEEMFLKNVKLTF